MDDVVIRGMAKWPDVPAVYGWLELDRRGDWRIKGERVTNPVVAAFIGRNYARDEQGRWFFQNGPQRVFVTLEYTPLVYRFADAGLEAHTGAPVASIGGAWLDEAGNLLLLADPGIGVLLDRDLPRVLPLLVDAAGEPLGDDALGALSGDGPSGAHFDFAGKRVPLGRIPSGEVAARFGFVARPEPPAGRDPC